MNLVVADLFCGGGGASQGLVEACKELGINLKLYAVNHWKAAVDVHRERHPNAVHKCAEVGAINPRTFISEGYLDLLIAAPECIFHSQARGGKPIDDQRRSTAWGVVDWAEAMRPKQILIENVPEFKKWGPLHHCDFARMRRRRVQGKMRKVQTCERHGTKCKHNKPDKSKQGSIYKQYIGAFEALGYVYEQRECVAADVGGATTRKRLFVMLHQKGYCPIWWPKQTHSAEATSEFAKWRAAREVIDWSLKGDSIFNRARPLAPKTMQRILAGLEKYGGEELKPFLVILRNHMDGKPIDGPIPTIAAAGQHIGVAHPVLVEANKKTSGEPIVFPLTHHGNGDRATPVDSGTLPTITGANRGELALAEAFVLSQASGGAARPVSEPVPAICTDGAHQLIEGVLVEYHSEKKAGEARVKSVDDPLPTQTTENRFGIAQPFLISAGGPTGQGRNPQSIEAPITTVLAEDHKAIVEPFIVPPRNRSKGGVDSVDRPIRTIVGASGHTFGLASAAMVPLYGERPTQEPRAHSVDEPMPVIPATGDGKFGLAEGVITSYYGTLNVSPVTKPIPSVTTKDRFGLVQPVINGYALDIRFRMLQPHELAAAMDFPVGYFPKPKTSRKAKGFTKGAIVKMIGNAWDVKQGKALCLSMLSSRIAFEGNKKEKVA
jgi:DNA (cytosine-5)-methyltransferase 1